MKGGVDMSGMPRVPNCTPETALIIYHSYPEIGNAQIRELFGEGLSPSTISKLKVLARKQMREDGKLAFRPTYVNTKSAYKAWGIDVFEVEEGFKKLQKLKLIKTTI